MTGYKVAYNDCWGGFTLSREAVLLAREISGNPRWGGAVLKGETYTDGSVRDFDHGNACHVDVKRHDPVLIRVLETLGTKRAGGPFSRLEIAHVDRVYRITEHAGLETVQEPSDLEWIDASEPPDAFIGAPEAKTDG
jgi:hypothetical protein